MLDVYGIHHDLESSAEALKHADIWESSYLSPEHFAAVVLNLKKLLKNAS
jgi:hypothetical protein